MGLAADQLTGTTHALLLGIAAGLAVALPLGAIGVLLVREGLVHGWRPAAAAAAGVASVDMVYAVVAVFAGSWVAGELAGHERAVRLVGAGVLAAVVVVGVTRVVRDSRRSPQTDELPTTTTAAAFARFVGLTAVNPLTALTFAAIAIGLGPRLAGAPQRVAFVLGVASASLAWQLVLAAAGAFLGARVSARTQTVLQLAGLAVVVVFVLVLAVG